jgi:MFS transporter, PHS family, inorganic phosphate transporter
LESTWPLSETNKPYPDVRAVLVAGVGFFLDSYDIFAINLITTLIGLVFWSGSPEDARYGFGGNNGALPNPVNQALKASTSAGIVIGQIVFGWLADVFGRRRMYGVELGIIILATFSCALVSPSQSMNFTGLMVFWRVIMVCHHPNMGRSHPAFRFSQEIGHRHWRRLPSFIGHHG